MLSAQQLTTGQELAATFFEQLNWAQSNLKEQPICDGACQLLIFVKMEESFLNQLAYKQIRSHGYLKLQSLWLEVIGPHQVR